ncbi:EAL domain-containing protein [Paracoccus aerodenitrificans]|uniref:EAL domain-containing protein n=1 Tax=Paracoccus aerodenitrificans TaxID=3017781 RepID=UPI0022F131B5|nr:EAL domain-containing protein [Paracoccus aerodenitrificans]WBU64920.1 EAL domain-containing protein [Paracoccus aerodenitrificans]
MRLIGLLSSVLAWLYAALLNNPTVRSAPVRTQGYGDRQDPRKETRIGFRPQICCDTGTVASLLVVPPVHLAGDAYTTLCTALRQYSVWRDEGLKTPPLVIELPREIAETAQLAQPLIWEIDRQDMDSQRIIFSAPSSGGRDTRLEGMALLARFGCGVEVNCLDQMALQILGEVDPEIARLRIPAGFLENCHSTPQSGRLILSLLAVADRFGAQSVAETVESRKDHGFLAQLGCNIVQGEAVAPVLDPGATAVFLSEYAGPQIAPIPYPRPAA